MNNPSAPTQQDVTEQDKERNYRDTHNTDDSQNNYTVRKNSENRPTVQSYLRKLLENAN